MAICVSIIFLSFMPFVISGKQKMRELRDFIIKKRQEHLEKTYVGQRTY